MNAKQRIRGKAYELFSELRSVLSGRFKLLDAIFPPVVFLVVNSIAGFDLAMWVALAIAATLAIFRLVRSQSLIYASGGVFGVLFAFLLARWTGRAEGFFLPSILNSVLMVLLCIVSVLVGKPFVAWSSFLARRWPLAWYWLPEVRPAYSEVTLMWGTFFMIRVVIQLGLFQQQKADSLAWLNLLGGWPALVILLVISYLYGVWRLENLGGPSVEEFRSGALPPWQGQRRGF